MSEFEKKRDTQMKINKSNSRSDMMTRPRPKCEYGALAPLGVTSPNKPSQITNTAVVGSYVFIISLVLLFTMIFSSNLEQKSKWVVFVCVTATLVAMTIADTKIVKKFEGERPKGSCATSSAFSSTQTMYTAFALFTSFSLRKYFDADNGKVFNVMFGMLWLLTIGSRVVLKDHSPKQVFMGTLIGAGSGGITSSVIVLMGSLKVVKARKKSETTVTSVTTTVS